MRTKNQSTTDWASLALVVPPVLIFIGSDLLLAWFGWYGLAPLPSLAPQPHADAAGRLYILSALLAACGVSFLTLVLFARDLVAEFDARMRRLLLLTLLTGLVVGSLWMTLSGRYFAVLANPLGIDVVGKATELFGSVTDGDRDAKIVATRLDTLIFVARAGLMIGAALTIVGAVSCLVRPLPPPAAKARAFLLRQRLRLRLYVNAAAALMVASIVFQLAWTRWPQALFEPAAAKAFSAHVDAFALYSGVTSSLVIASFAVPVVAGLRARAAALTEEGEDAEAPVLLDAGLMDGLGKILVVLAPALAGILPTIADLLQLRS
ncbi:hypothetical protein FHS95_003582 [Sphingomonas naasensis]|uniref:Uncharacterized protein n=1 Tax=Sphingomonas naasensis TaxID=1344951 RepID=A0A4S1WIB6_9SPHN|nr:hypothetical protein [Sphingomonas naasensis]NIJ21871.1 hypothetical protein [Sphingomonas naasensis]TGX42433.1 hypothetical protein E5A74_11370 [Sphingomonas naasensis]